MRTLTMSKVVFLLHRERKFQDDKHGSIEESGHTIGEWLLLIEAELVEAKQALIKGGKGRDSVMSEIVQIGALALAAIEEHGIQEREGRSV
jgi:hypothetical protein